jgi:hypothetical protein
MRAEKSFELRLALVVQRVVCRSHIGELGSPPCVGSTCADSSDALAETGRNELSLCQPMLPMIMRMLGAL